MSNEAHFELPGKSINIIFATGSPKIQDKSMNEYFVHKKLLFGVEWLVLGLVAHIILRMIGKWLLLSTRLQDKFLEGSAHGALVAYISQLRCKYFT